MLVHPVLEMGYLASLPGFVADENKGREMDEMRTWDDRGLEDGQWGIEAGAPERRSVVPC
jgi:hypothetical protein